MANQSYAGDLRTSYGILNLGTETLSQSGSLLLGTGTTLTGTGTLVASGSTILNAPLVQGSATLVIAGRAAQLGFLTIGNTNGMPSTAGMTIAAGGSDTLDAAAGFGGSGTLTVAGALIANGNAISQIATSIVDQGTIAANHGDLQILGNVSAGSTGLFAIGGTAELDFLNASTIGASTFVSFTAGGAGTLRIDDMKTFGATIENFGASDMIQIAGIGTSANGLYGTYGNTAHTQIVVDDSAGNTITLAFSTAQNLSAFTFSDANSVLTIAHS